MSSRTCRRPRARRARRAHRDRPVSGPQTKASTSSAPDSMARRTSRAPSMTVKPGPLAGAAIAQARDRRRSADWSRLVSTIGVGERHRRHHAARGDAGEGPERQGAGRRPSRGRARRPRSPATAAPRPSPSSPASRSASKPGRVRRQQDEGVRARGRARQRAEQLGQVVHRGATAGRRAHGRTTADRGRGRRSGALAAASRPTKPSASSTIQRTGRSARPDSSAFRRAHVTAGRDASTCVTAAPAAARASVASPV